MWFWKKKKYDFYLAGGMRGYPNLNKDMFTHVARGLRSLGFTVWSPAEHASYLKLSFAECMTVDLNKVINDCRKIAFLPRWRESLGANMEAFVAFACGKDSFEVTIGKPSSLDLIPVDLSSYLLPYQMGHDRRKFDPHKCSVDAPGD